MPPPRAMRLAPAWPARVTFRVPLTCRGFCLEQEPVTPTTCPGVRTHAPADAPAPARDAAPFNTRLVLAHRPSERGIADCFRLEHAALPALRDGQLLLRTEQISIDICAAGRMQAFAPDGDTLGLGEVMPCSTVSRVLASRHVGFKEGDQVLAHSGWQTHEVVDGIDIRRKLHPGVAPAGTALGVYGLYGFIGWSAVREVCAPRPGDTMVLAAAAGPIGTTAGQLAQRQGARIVAVTSSEAKCRHLREKYGFAVALDRHAPDFVAQLQAACPDGIDIFLEGVHGHCIDTVMPLLNDGARLPLCGIMEGELWPMAADRLPAFFNAILMRRLVVRSFTHRDIIRLHPQYLVDPAFLSEMGALLRGGQLGWDEQIVDGLEQAPLALEKLACGDNLGKLIVRVA
ncbi:NADP-dependent oxidoreductase [Pseudoxanthomonas japonensis]|uniref:NADP-dependent oxidoreductase n=1 Tax=Pseudoxanthomonas japonensis TaxID=69284 RepID=A0ABQ6ZLP8_9GAMM|nr:NADP-dependent oxidoreductase [Pseudoxanthomonas japonensis]